MGVGDPTGRWLVTMRHGSVGSALKTIRQKTGIAANRTFKMTGTDTETLPPAAPDRIVWFKDFDVAIVDASSTAAAALQQSAGPGTAIVAVEPERVRGACAPPPAAAAAPYADTAALSWALTAMGVGACAWTGAGVTLAVLDTGLDHAHPDFAGRCTLPKYKKAFLPGTTAAGLHDTQDHNGHGTHVTGAAAGPATPCLTRVTAASNVQRRYGVAPGVTLCIGRVLDDAALGTDESILAGMKWAIGWRRKSSVILLALGSADTSEIAAYGQVAAACHAKGCVVIAAAGNAPGATTPGTIMCPASAPKILAVGSVKHDLALAAFSPNPSGTPAGRIDVVAPGVDVWTCTPIAGAAAPPVAAQHVSGTSMSAGLVAGLAALRVEKSGHTLLGAALGQAIRATADHSIPGHGDPRAGMCLAVVPTP